MRKIKVSSGLIEIKSLNSLMKNLRYGVCIPVDTDVLSADDLPMIAAETASPQQKSPPAEQVDALNSLFGKQQRGRAVHAKGIVLKGSFMSVPTTASLSDAPHFHNVSIPITVQFSSFAGIPDNCEIDGLAAPCGLAIKFHLPDGPETDLASHSFNGFPTATSDEFQLLLNALAASDPNVPLPTKVEKFLSSHPVARTFLTTRALSPVSYATMPYYSVNTFKFTNSEGSTAFGRYQIMPQAGAHFLSGEQSPEARSDYLAKEIRRRLDRKRPVLTAFS
jgi:catalase